MPGKRALECWMDVARTLFKNQQSEPLDRDNFFAELKAEPLADIDVVSWHLAPRISRYNGSEQDSLVLAYFGRGFSIELNDHSVVRDASAGLYLLDSSTAVASRALEPAACFGLRVSRKILAQRIPITTKVTNRPIPVQGDAALLAGFLSEISRVGPSTLSSQASMVVREHALDLCALTLAPMAGGRRPELGSPARMALLKVRVAIESNLTNPRADRNLIAAAAGFSERYVNRLLEQEGTSFRQLLTERRLVKCREALERGKQSIGEIAYGFGFGNPAHFTRAFKKRYGVTPGEHRASHCLTHRPSPD